MERKYSEYSIPELQEALAIVDGARYPDNKAALETEFQARRDSGEFDRFVQEAAEAREQHTRGKIDFAKKMQKPIAVYLVVTSMYTFVLAGIGLNAANWNANTFVLIVFAAYLVAMAIAGVGLFLAKGWSYRAALVVLALQVIKVQSSGLVFAAGSLFYFYVYVSSTPDLMIGFDTRLFTPELTLGYSPNAPTPLWIGVNLVAIFMIVLLRRVRYEED